MPKKHVVEITVRSYEVDVYGHVNHAVYLNYMEYARVQSLQDTGKSFADYTREQIFIVVVQANITYRAPAYIGDRLTVTTSLKKIGRTSVVLQQDIEDLTQQQECVKAEITFVFLDQNQKPIPVPAQFLQQLGWHEN